MKCNYHTHTDYCDGKASAAVMADQAAALGYKILGFSSHAPLPFPTEWNLQFDRVQDYLAEIAGLAAQWEGRMEILCGMEIDYIRSIWGPQNPYFRSFPLDYRLGAVHYIYHPELPPGRFVAVDMHPDEVRSYIKDWYDNDATKLVQAYYQAMGECIDQGGFDILAHLDLIKSNNARRPLFDEESDWYKDAVMAVVEQLGHKDLIVEINTGGLARSKAVAVYPSGWILKELRQRAVPVCISADAHGPGHYDPWYQAGIEAARQAGYRELCQLNRQGRFTVALE
ncbi:MAG: histidinol-phosphatase [Spirochaetes bacterium]|nr:histidinol-phosphatase [Spirochaetota bacterium]